MTSPTHDNLIKGLKNRVKEILSSLVDLENLEFDVFISYRQPESKIFARHIYAILKRGRHPVTHKSLRVFLDDEQIKPGQNIHAVLQNAISASACFIVLLTSTYNKTEYTTFEQMLIAGMDLGGVQERVIPVLIQKCEVPERLKAIKYFDFTSYFEKRNSSVYRDEQIIQNSNIDFGLLVLNGADKGKKITLPTGKPIVIGRNHYEVDFELSDDLYISNRHCQIKVLNEKVEVIDLNSTNGTYVHETRLGDLPVNIHPGDRIGLGQTTLLLLTTKKAKPTRII